MKVFSMLILVGLLCSSIYGEEISREINGADVDMRAQDEVVKAFAKRTINPAIKPTVTPFKGPVNPSGKPSVKPTVIPSIKPTVTPSKGPVNPSKGPVNTSVKPTTKSTVKPTRKPFNH